MDVVIGRIGRAHGVRGELAVDVRTDDPDRRFTAGARLGTDPVSSGPLTVSGARAHGGRLLVRFEEVADRTAAEELRGVLLTVNVPDDAVPETPDEFYDHQLVGLRVCTTGMPAVGEVVDVVHNPAHDLLLVRLDRGGEVLVPFVAALVPEVDTAAGRLTVVDRPGLLDPDQMVWGGRVRIDLVSIFPEYFDALDLSLAGKARDAGLLDVRAVDLRRWTHDRHHTVDDTPYGGGPGMVMKPEPWGEALDDLVPEHVDPAPRMLVMTPSGRRFDQRLAEELAHEPWLVVACGRYEGIDQRVVEEASGRMPVDEVSIGDYVLNGGEVAALVVLEAVVRLLPGFMGNPESLHEESHAAGAYGGLLEYPVYTKPPVWRGREVPDVLRSGNHGRVARWRRDEALRRTARRRPDLILARDPGAWNSRDREVLAESGLILEPDAAEGKGPI